MPLHPDNCHIIDVRGGINDPKHRFGGSFQLWIWKLGEDGKVAMASWADWGEFSAQTYLLYGVDKKIPILG